MYFKRQLSAYHNEHVSQYKLDFTTSAKVICEFRFGPRALNPLSRYGKHS